MNSTDDFRRPRLIPIFDLATLHSLTVVSAGAGYGKTRAVTDYLEQKDCRSVWLSLTALDNIPSRFWENFCAAVKIRKPQLSSKLIQLGFPDTLQAFDAFLSEFTEDLYRDHRFVIFVFDDVHVITVPSIQKFLRDFINTGMENSSIILISRQWPIRNLELSMLPYIIGINELRFTLEETTELYARIKPDVGEPEVKKLHEYVFGWPMALSMAVNYLSQLQAAEKARELVSSAKPVLFSVFEEVIFSQYTEMEQNLLIKLSILDSFPRGLVSAVAAGAWREIHHLLRDNQFINYDGEKQRLSFHPLYHEFLREKLKGIRREELDGVYQKAAEWCRQSGLLYDAVIYFRQCGAYKEVWETLLMFEVKWLSKSEAAFFIYEIETLPEAFKQEYPMTRIVMAVFLLNNLRFAEAGQMIAEVERQLENWPPEEADQSLLGECYVAHGLIILGMEQDGFVEYFVKAAKLLPEGSRRWGKGVHLVDIGPGITIRNSKPGELERRVAAFQEGMPYISRVLHGAGQGLDELCRCEALFLTGEVKRAVEPAYQALYMANSAAQYDILGNALFMLLRIYMMLGDYKGVMEAFEHINRYQKDEETANLAIWDIVYGWFYTEMGSSDNVAGWIRNAVQNGHPPISIDRPLLIRLRCLLLEGNPEEALALLAQFEHLAQSKQSVIWLIYIELGRADAHHHFGNMERAMAAFKSAYQLARDNRIIMPFIEYGSRTRSLAEYAQHLPNPEIEPEWLELIRVKASTFAKKRSYLINQFRQKRGMQPSDFGLSKRERELLRYLGQGLTREEISESMNLSLNTVKSMLKQIFSKMGAINSVDAIRIAVINQLI